MISGSRIIVVEETRDDDIEPPPEIGDTTGVLIGEINVPVDEPSEVKPVDERAHVAVVPVDEVEPLEYVLPEEEIVGA